MLNNSSTCDLENVLDCHLENVPDSQCQLVELFLNCHNLVIIYRFDSYLNKTTLMTKPTCLITEA